MEKQKPKARLLEEVSTVEVEQRSLLMRLYRSRNDGEPAYPAEIAERSYALRWALRDRLVIRRGQGYRITEKGIRRWARMCSPLLTQSSPTSSNELRHYAGLPYTVTLTPAAKRILDQVVEGEGKLHIQDADAFGVNTLRNAGCVVIDGDHLLLTAVGWSLVGTETLKKKRVI